MWVLLLWEVIAMIDTEPFERVLRKTLQHLDSGSFTPTKFGIKVMETHAKEK
jgi:hypothetical protein